jgi:hypothetical protein
MPEKTQLDTLPVFFRYEVRGRPRHAPFGIGVNRMAAFVPLPGKHAETSIIIADVFFLTDRIQSGSGP